MDPIGTFLKNCKQDKISFQIKQFNGNTVSKLSVHLPKMDGLDKIWSRDSKSQRMNLNVCCDFLSPESQRATSRTYISFVPLFRPRLMTKLGLQLMPVVYEM